MSNLGHTLVVVSFLCSIGCGTAIAMIVAYRTEWKPLIAALTRKCDELEARLKVKDTDYNAMVRAYTARENEVRTVYESMLANLKQAQSEDHS